MKRIIYFNIFLLALFTFFYNVNIVNAKKIPNLVGTWQGENIKSTLKKGFLRSNNTVEITEQADRLFKGFVIHKGGKEASCHVGYRSCFYRSVPTGDHYEKIELKFIEDEKSFDPEKIYEGHENPTKL